MFDHVTLPKSKGKNERDRSLLRVHRQWSDAAVDPIRIVGTLAWMPSSPDVKEKSIWSTTNASARFACLVEPIAGIPAGIHAWIDGGAEVHIEDLEVTQRLHELLKWGHGRGEVTSMGASCNSWIGPFFERLFWLLVLTAQDAAIEADGERPTVIDLQPAIHLTMGKIIVGPESGKPPVFLNYEDEVLSFGSDIGWWYSRESGIAAALAEMLLILITENPVYLETWSHFVDAVGKKYDPDE